MKSEIKIDHRTGDYVPYSFRTVCVVPQIIRNKCCETGPTVYCPYPRRLESLTVCRCGDVQQCREFLSINLETTLVVQKGYERHKVNLLVVRALASHQCGPGSIPGLDVICGLILLLVLVPAPRVFLRVLRFSSLHKNQHFQIPIPSGIRGPQVCQSSDC